ncbi:glycosyltransferase family 2 protein [Xenorhabdus sp. PB61.4]|uniref:glycosyltransferase family 2 protein n=1 Tax=Xenorhabdus sp. PB61.4 TaxID=2788940 RepID=UPI001E383029|nr:glycosyltransferase family A protein [Xenorhabdus sp. PB61.4]MCC8365001.1 glycosyltransferase family 2 protein [Xenorhabdus sp. PB61.4]
MIFSDKSDVTIVITSCGRFSLLTSTLQSLDKHNTYPIKKIIITEDSGNEKILDVIPKNWQPHCEIIINRPKLGQIKSIDLAYEKVDTKYIFHCEDDWLFYRDNFIEDSRILLEKKHDILQVWLRDFNKDIKINYPFHYPSNPQSISGVDFSVLESNDETWKGFSFNPGLRRKSDYLRIAPYYVGKDFDKAEAHISKLYYEEGMYAVILKSSATKHIGWNQHVINKNDILRNKNKKRKKIKYFSLGFISGCILSFIALIIMK